MDENDTKSEQVSTFFIPKEHVTSGGIEENHDYTLANGVQHLLFSIL